MKTIKKPVKFKSLSLPEPLFNEMKSHVKNDKRYRTMAEFLRTAIREKMSGDDMFLLSPEEWYKKHNKTLDKRVKKITEGYTKGTLSKLTIESLNYKVLNLEKKLDQVIALLEEKLL